MLNTIVNTIQAAPEVIAHVMIIMALTVLSRVAARLKIMRLFPHGGLDTLLSHAINQQTGCWDVESTLRGHPAMKDFEQPESYREILVDVMTDMELLVMPFVVRFGSRK